MSYAAEETSAQSGAPIELYDFVQDVAEWHYTSSEASYTDATQSPSVVYTSAPIERTAIESTPEKARNALKLTVPRNLAVAELFRVSPPSEVIDLTVRRVHRGDTASLATIWIGRVLSCEFTGASATLQCEPISVSLARTGLRRVFQAACPHVLYGAGCTLSRTDFDHATTVSALSGLDLTVASQNASYSYAGGFVEWVNDSGVTERRFIESAALNSASPQKLVLTLLQPFAGIAVSDAVTIYPGCDHTLTTCNSTFGNALNYGGFPYFPSKNPFAVSVF